MNYRTKIYRHYATYFQIKGYLRPDLERRWASAYKWFFRRWLPLEKAARIADVGCGGGQMLAAFRRLGYQSLVGVDISEQQVGLARRAGFDVECGDAMAFLSSHCGEFDLITAIDILEHLNKDEVMTFFEMAHAALRPGGRLILQMPNPNSPAGMRIRYGDFTHEVCLSPDCAGRLLSLTGFESCESRETGPVPSWTSIVSLMRWFLWQALRLGFIVYELIETGGWGTAVYTRVYLVTGRRPA
jgi:SAM-dependent methyltransferase